MDSLQTDNLTQDMLPSIIKARCPSCFKLYAIDAAEIHESKPQFACSKCTTQFWFPFPESLEQKEILGFPVEWLKVTAQADAATAEAAALPETAAAPSTVEPIVAPTPNASARLFHCPRCQAQYSAGDPECPKCGVIFAKLEMDETSRAIASSPALRRLWHQVMDNYNNIEAHRKFVQIAQRENNLLFASHQYRRLLAAHSGDETALKMQREIIAITEAVQGVSGKTTRARSFKLMPRLTTLVLCGAGALIGFGLMIEAARNLIGLGVALVFFTLAARWLMDN
ncbi:MAG: hypothetical protein AB7N80_15935 [Bdellovibrionales bacterium]